MGDEPENLEEVQRKLQEIQTRKRARIRWNMSKHTAELAIGALAVEPRQAPRRGKSRRRKRKKRLL